MARFHVPQLSEFPYHITARCPNRRPFPLPLSEIWTLFQFHLSLVHYRYDLKIHAAVLMPNHFHMICRTGSVPIGKCMSVFMGELSKDINFRANRINQNWGGRHYKCVIPNYRHMINTYKYVYQNPKRAHLCRHVEEWPYSTLNGLLGLSRLEIPLEPDAILFNPNFDQQELKWLNRMPNEDDLQSIRKALRKKSFQLPSVRTLEGHHLETGRL